MTVEKMESCLHWSRIVTEGQPLLPKGDWTGTFSILHREGSLTLVSLMKKRLCVLKVYPTFSRTTDVDYGGSTGYGKTYRSRLAKNWGIVDVQDTISCVEHLSSSGKVDKDRVAITGGSAGGYTVLASLCDGKVFGAGISHYGVSDLKLLADDTHKVRSRENANRFDGTATEPPSMISQFESQYLFNLLGGTPEEVPDVYRGQ